ncbi:hypothetical protein [Methyloligella halotolerans]|nr:hypothetical protein [Methyloligella halotolerans]
MLEVKAHAFVHAAAVSARVQAILESTNYGDKDDVVSGDTLNSLLEHLDDLSEAMKPLSLTLTQMAVDGMRSTAEAGSLKFGDVSGCYKNIQGRMFDELSLVSVFCIDRNRSKFYSADTPLFGESVEKKFKNAAFEVEEAGKCLALRRSTACVFHLMRVLEVGIRSVARSLSIDDPTKAGEKNWGKILKK